MESKVIILGAGIGAMTLAFENAGCQVVEAYENDKRAIELYKKNINGKIEKLDQLWRSKPENMSDIDILVCDFYRDISDDRLNKKDANDFNNAIKFILDYERPRSICCFIPKTYLKSEQFVHLLNNIRERGYNYSYNRISTEKATGLPIIENRFYLVACDTLLGVEFKFPNFNERIMISPEEILENKNVEEFYYKVNCNYIGEISTENTFLCWKKSQYVESNFVNANLIKNPLVKKEEIIRKITHREWARLKRIPDNYWLDTKNKAWMYKQLMDAPNVEIMTHIARNIRIALEGNALQKSRMMREQAFNDVLKKYLIQKCDNVEPGKWCDFKCSVHGKEIYFELKIYNSDYAIERNVKRVCEILLSLKKMM